MKNPFRTPTLEEKARILLSSRVQSLFEAQVAAIAHSHHIQRLEAEIAFLASEIKLHEKKGRTDGND